MTTKVIVNIGLTDRANIALVKYETAPDMQQGAMLPSAVVDEGEDVNDVAVEVLRSTLDVKGVTLKIVDADSFVGHDGTWHVSLTYQALVPEIPTLHEGQGVQAYITLNRAQCQTAVLAHRNWTLRLISSCMD
ncbi:Hypothetical protein NGAL_HAMBI2605_51820 [Neorhizobium galegae bv. orientalis]|nr:Hypothetical protein NGAL_HAMBI2605_51820 [Neorhizobium galegae bv. orientalis]